MMIIDTMCVRWQIPELLKILKKPLRHLLVGGTGCFRPVGAVGFRNRCHLRDRNYAAHTRFNTVQNYTVRHEVVQLSLPFLMNR